MIAGSLLYPEPARDLVDQMVEAASHRPDAAIAFQGAPGCNGHMAAIQAFPEGSPLPCFSFEDALEAVSDGTADCAIIPIENSLHGRVADIHHLLPESGLSIVGEYFLPVQHCLLGMAHDAPIREVLSHPQALGQCRRTLRTLGLRPVAFANTASAAAHVAAKQDSMIAALAPPLAGQLYGLKVLRSEMSDGPTNITRFVILAREPDAATGNGPWITTLVFAVRSVPAALFKALGGFATNGVNLTKLESYQQAGSFLASEFYCDIEGHPRDTAVARALEELSFQSSSVRVLGTYPSARPRGPSADCVVPVAPTSPGDEG